MPQRRGTATQQERDGERHAENDGRAERAVEQKGHPCLVEEAHYSPSLSRFLPFDFATRSASLAFVTISSMRFSSSSVRRAPSPPRRAPTTFSAEPSKNVSTRCFSAD